MFDLGKTAGKQAQVRSFFYCWLFGFFGLKGLLPASPVPPDDLPASDARLEADGVAAGLGSEGGGQLTYNEKTQRLEVRDASGIFLDEMAPGTVGKAVDAGNQEYRISFGKDERDRLSILVRPGPAMRRPVTLDLLGRKSVLSPDASLSATMVPDGKVIYEPSICGQVYYIDDLGSLRGKVSRLAGATGEIAVLAPPSSPVGGSAENENEPEERFEGMNQAGDTMKSVVLTFFGLPDKEPTPKAKVYRLKGSSSSVGGNVGDVQASGTAQSGAK